MEKSNLRFNWPLIGNKHITDFLERAVIHGNLAGAYIFYGPDNLGKATLAEHFAKIILCQKPGNNLPCQACPSCLSFKEASADNGANSTQEFKIIHSDCHIIKKDKDKKNITIEQAREFIRILSMSSFLGDYKIGIIRDAETLSQEASNALLKTLEEPKEKVIIILIAKNLETIPRTVISRSQFLNFYPVSTDIIYNYLVGVKKVSRSQAKNLARLALGRPALASKFLEDGEYYQLYLYKIETFFNFLGQDLAERFSAIESLVGVRAGGQESAHLAKKVLEAWQGVVRDWLLLEYGHINLIQNQVKEDIIIKLQKRFKTNELVELLKALRRAEEYIEANVNPKTALENVAMNI